LERVSLALERPLNRLVHDPRLNPLYHTGTITVFLLLVIAATGVYLTMFFQFGFAGSYRAVSNIEASLVGRVIRALHRYASDLAVMAALLHGWRTFVMDRFRGPRWLAWVTGAGLAVVAWIIGVSGYWLISDSRAQLLNQTLVDAVGRFRLGAAFINSLLATDTRGAGWLFTLLLILIHLGLSVVVGLVFWLHIRRLSRPKWLPPRFWLLLAGLPLLLAALLAPVGMLPALDPGQLPGQVNLDAFYLFYLPAALRWPPAALWAGVTVALALLTALPWLLGRQQKPPVTVDAARCTGCTLCAADCPYRAITMVERGDGRPHRYLAVVNPQMCVGCGVCIGACEPLALSLAGQPAEALWEQAAAAARDADGQPVKVVFVCERHASPPGDGKSATTATKPASAGSVEHVALIPLPCIGMAPPDLAARALAAGAAGVQFIGCPPEDCTNREGNLWLQQRLARERPPRLDRNLAGAPITADWLPADDLGRGLAAAGRQPYATAYGMPTGRLARRGLVAAAGLIAAALLLTIPLSRLSWLAYGEERARVEVVMAHQPGQPLKQAGASGPAVAPPDPLRLAVEVDGKTVVDRTYGEAAPLAALEQAEVAPGTRRIRLLLSNPDGQSAPQVWVDETLMLAPRQVRQYHFVDQPADRDPAAGRKLFVDSSCRVCHSLDPGVRLVGPSLAGIAAAAETRVPGQTAEAYLRESIVAPDAFITPGYPAGQMLPDLGKTLSEKQIEDLVAFLLTLK
jgi:ferredoxin